ncbi:ribonuclease domain-containing protein [Kitasatospora mediocidica]|uniref:ribonuclease domain-containing protein n=1 Tax=Kitasatospora mediocidica TaxID=58352 RepID=UPI00055D990B|nr:ribonuclease domain-containing protein [Kitasatospora mediocidica]
MTSRTRLTTVAVLLACVIAVAAAYALIGRHQSAGPAASSRATASARATTAATAQVCQSKLPSQARDTLGLIAKGGPYPYRSDGIVFDNREGRLPKQRSGYYHEYTVVTPGSGDRGTRRVVTGGPGEEYWTDDHYSTFQTIDPHC